MGKIRGTHSSPGIYTKITDIEYAAKTLGITTAGLVGETLQGPAFEPMMVKDFGEFQSVFGGTSPEKFKDTQYPKYELPYIAKSYLSKSDQLYVCRVLGLSGYNAGPAFIITASDSTKDDGEKYVIGILRSRGSYNLTGYVDPCDTSVTNTYDQVKFVCKSVSLKPYNGISLKGGCEPSASAEETDTTIPTSLLNYGQFIIETTVKTGVDEKGNDIDKVNGSYSVSLNPGDKNYIYKVLGATPFDGSADVFIEELYDLHLEDLIKNGLVDTINTEVVSITDNTLKIVTEPVTDILNLPMEKLNQRNIGRRYLAVNESISVKNAKDVNFDAFSNSIIGTIYTVEKITDKKTNKTKIVYKTTNEKLPVSTCEITNVVKVLSEDVYYFLKEYTENIMSGNTILETITETFCEPYLSFSNYKEQFRSATTPWFVSQSTVSFNKKTITVNVNKLFRFHTISDGNNANALVKISIANIMPEEGTFDVLVRDYYDTDAAPIVLESYKSVTLKKGDDKYIGLKIGTLDGEFSLKSKYVMIELNDSNIELEGLVPCGFLGYPVRSYNPYNLVTPSIVYNTEYNNNIRDKKQYFGMSDLTGVDFDVLNYKGKDAYLFETGDGFTDSFHLDSYLNKKAYSKLGSGYNIIYTIDNIEVKDIKWATVSPDEVTDEMKSPTIGTDEEMSGTIYENVKLRKFTCYPYGGFDGWDIYRGERTIGDEFKANKYKGKVSSDTTSTFSTLSDNATLNLSGRAITSDYYAFLAGVKQFEDPERHVINLFATPGIDYVNAKDLSTEILEMLEEKRMDTLYIMTTPDKPKGASDLIDEMFTPSDVVSNLEDSDIDSYYATTYYPWVKYFDDVNNVYINLPATKDAIRNMADVDNKKYPWYAPAGLERGKVECKKMHFFAKLEDEDTLYDGRINPLKTYSKDGVKIWGNKTLYKGNTPMEGVNVVRLMLYMRKLIIEATRGLIFEPNDITLKNEFESIVKPILAQIKKDRGITDFRLDVSQTPEQMDAHELSATLYVKPTPTLEYIEINFVVTPQGVSFDSL
jgi:hypothetical protein